MTKGVLNQFSENDERIRFGKLYIGHNLSYIEYNMAKFLKFDNIVVVKDSTMRGHLVYFILIQYNNTPVATVTINPSNVKENNEKFEAWLKANNIDLFQDLMDMQKNYKGYLSSDKLEIIL